MGEVKSLSFCEKHTTAELIAADVKDGKEKEKVVLSNDAYAIGQLIECLVNKINR